MSTYDLLLMVHFLGLALAVGTGFANMTLGMATADMEPADRVKFFLRAFALSKNGSIGLLLLLLSGVGLALVPGLQATMLRGGGAFHAKLTLVLIAIALLGRIQVLIKKAKQEQGGPAMAQIPKVGRALLLTGIGIVVCAVLAFH